MLEDKTMNSIQNEQYGAMAADQEQVNAYVSKVFVMMAMGLGVTALLGFLTANITPLLTFAYNFRFPLIIGELALVFFLAARVQKMSPDKAMGLFLAYSALNGVSLTPFVIQFHPLIITKAFVISSGMFGSMAVWGLTTKKDLTSLGSLCFMGLIGLVLASVVNLFFPTPGFGMILSYVGVAVFIGLTAYDAQKIKNIAASGQATGQLAVLGALMLYLDFINLFIYVLSILGNRD